MNKDKQEFYKAIMKKASKKDREVLEEVGIDLLEFAWAMGFSSLVSEK